MAKKKYEFRPDSEKTSLFSHFHLTASQRRGLLKGSLFALMLLVLSLLQDVILSRFRLFGVTTDLVPCAIILICVICGSEKGCVFTLVASALYQFSGGPGYYVILLLPMLSLLAAMFRQGYLHQKPLAEMVCTALATVLYQLCVFAVCLLLERTSAGRITQFLLTAALTLVAIPVLYPICRAIDRLGGEV